MYVRVQRLEQAASRGLLQLVLTVGKRIPKQICSIMLVQLMLDCEHLGTAQSEIIIRTIKDCFDSDLAANFLNECLSWLRDDVHQGRFAALDHFNRAFDGGAQVLGI